MFEPREHIMRAPVAAQDCESAALLPKSLSPGINPEKALSPKRPFLGFD
jgi:hypothetical protein